MTSQTSDAIELQKARAALVAIRSLAAGVLSDDGLPHLIAPDVYNRPEDVVLAVKLALAVYQRELQKARTENESRTKRDSNLITAVDDMAREIASAIRDLRP